jgi:hypothetical protein
MDIPMQVQTLRSRFDKVQAQQARVETEFRQVVRQANLSQAQRHRPQVSLKKSRRGLKDAEYKLTQIVTAKRMRVSKKRQHLQHVDQVLTNSEQIMADILSRYGVDSARQLDDPMPEPPRPKNQQAVINSTPEIPDDKPEPDPPPNGGKEQE